MKKLITVIFIVAIIFAGKYIIDLNTTKFESIVSKSLSSYYINGDTKELQSIVELLEKVSFNDSLRKKIQDYSFNIVNSWYTYLDGKYNCSKSDLNSCLIKVEEYTLLNTKLQNLYNYKCKDGFTIILPSSYNNLSNLGTDNITTLNKIIKSPSAKEQKNSEEIRIEKCNNTISCEICRDGLCTCTYVDESKKSETITCVDLNTETN